MRILIASDAAPPQINGVVRVLDTTAEWLRRFGHEVRMVGPADFSASLPAPGYPEVRLAMTLGRTSLITEGGSEPLSKAPLDLVVR